MKITTAVNEYRLHLQHSEMAKKSYLEYTRGVGR